VSQVCLQRTKIHQQSLISAASHFNTARKMSGIKAKISNLLHKDKDTTHTTHNDGLGHDKHSTTGTGIAGTGIGSSSHTGHTTSSTGAVGDARTGMSDMDINQTTGTGVGGIGGVHSSTERVSGTGLGSSATGVTSGTRTGDVSQGVTRAYDTNTNEIIDQERFTKTEDHEVIIEKKAYELEHRPVEKKYVVETKYMGERTVPGRPTELLSTDVREVEERVVEMPRGDRTIIVENVDVPVGLESAGRAINAHGSSAHTTGSTTSTGYGDNVGSSGLTSGTGVGGTGTGLGNTGLGGTGTGLGGTGTGTGHTGLGGSNTGLGGGNTGLGSDSSRY
jgi:hypothetical protein